LSGYVVEEGSMYSLDGHCRSFDARASGTVRGDGVGVVVLKRLADALTARDHVLAVVKGSAINNDGGLKVGYTAPGLVGLMDVISSAQTVAGVSPETIGYVECHGSATLLGDPVEVAALTNVFAASTHRKGFCAIGSVKSSIGHLDVAGGIAGLIKTVLALQHGLVPPSLHFTEPNPEIDFANSAFHVATRLEPWPIAVPPRRAAVNSYGLGGTNAHVILEQAQVPRVPRAATRYVLSPISAPSSSALDRVTSLLHEHLRSAEAVDLGDVAYTLQVGRKHFAHRRAVVCRKDDVSGLCNALADGRQAISSTAGIARSVVFMFPGLGALSADIGRALCSTDATCRETIDRLLELLRARIGIELRHFFYPESSLDVNGAKLPGGTDASEPAQFIIEYALARLWMQWGVRPAAMIGEGVGEYVAAVLSEVVSLEDAVVLLAARTHLMRPCAAGTVSVEGASDAFDNEIAAVRFEPPQIPYVSSVTGTWITSADVGDRQYWRGQASQTRPRRSGIVGLAADPQRLVLEVGPGSTLSTLVRHLLLVPSAVLLTSFPESGDSPCVQQHLLNTMARIWTAGVDVDWHAFSASDLGGRIPLPTFPFERKRYWPDDATV
jgi:acyl transferase domain-containing protein